MDVFKIKIVCSQYSIKPAKSRGQNFLVNEEVVREIIKAASLNKSDTVLEVGPGLGVLTGELIKKVKKVVAVESDKKLVEFLRKEFDQERNLKIVRQDILKVGMKELGLKKEYFKVVANLPYSITSRFLRVFLDYRFEARPKEMVLMVQKEVAERIVAKPGKMSKLSVMCQFYSEPEVLFNVNKDNFWPVPEVDSAVIRLKLCQLSLRFASLLFKKKEIPRFFQVVNIGFSARRKQLQNNLAGGLKRKNMEIKQILADLGFDEKIRAQDLSVENWIDLTKKLKL